MNTRTFLKSLAALIPASLVLRWPFAKPIKQRVLSCPVDQIVGMAVVWPDKCAFVNPCPGHDWIITGCVEEGTIFEGYEVSNSWCRLWWIEPIGVPGIRKIAYMSHVSTGRWTSDFTTFDLSDYFWYRA